MGMLVMDENHEIKSAETEFRQDSISRVFRKKWGCKFSLATSAHTRGANQVLHFFPMTEIILSPEELWPNPPPLKTSLDSILELWPESRHRLAKIETKTDNRIESPTSVKNLDVAFDDDLGVDLHVNNIASFHVVGFSIPTTNLN